MSIDLIAAETPLNCQSGDKRNSIYRYTHLHDSRSKAI